MYGGQFYTYVDMTVLTKELCGLSRPVHVIKRMVKDLNIPVKVIGCPIIRELDGDVLAAITGRTGLRWKYYDRG